MTSEQRGEILSSKKQYGGDVLQRGVTFPFQTKSCKDSRQVGGKVPGNSCKSGRGCDDPYVINGPMRSLGTERLGPISAKF